jgi:carbamoyltransferase
MREGDGLSEPYIHIAAAAQKTLEDVVLDMVNTHLSDTLKCCNGKLCFAGGTALNVRLNRKLLEMPEVTSLFVQPAANDSGTSLGAATFIANKLGEKIEPMQHAYLGPEFSNEYIKGVLEKFKLPYEYHYDIENATANILSKGTIVAWFQGRMEFGPRALGNRSILANPATPGIADEVNGRIKFREKWRPFCPSILAERAPEFINTKHNSDYMTFSFIVDKKWAEKVPEIIHVDGSARPQTVRKDTNPKFHKLITEFNNITSLPIVLNTSLNRRGEPMICSPEEAVQMFYQCGLEVLVMGNYLIKK